jgi:CRISPR-associated endoribonuclease Cas6/Csy4 subtype I-F
VAVFLVQKNREVRFMLKYYIEIRLFPSQEIPHGFLLTKVYSKIHFALSIASTDGKCPVGISFPQMDEESDRVGNIIRLFAEKEATLEALHLKDAFRRYADYVHMTSVMEVRHVKGYETYSKMHFKNESSKIRRCAKMGNISQEEAKKKLCIPKDHPTYPAIQMTSSSTNQHYMLLIHRESKPGSTDGMFNTFGFPTRIKKTDAKATVPVFPVFG